jgi:hypothetical protein
MKRSKSVGAFQYRLRHRFQPVSVADWRAARTLGALKHVAHLDESWLIRSGS